MDAVVDDAHLHGRGFLQYVDVPGVGTLPLVHSPLRFDGEARVPLRVAPALGEHNEEIYRDWLGHSVEELDGWRRDGVI
jgi:formyl-CoA transferase